MKENRRAVRARAEGGEGLAIPEPVVGDSGGGGWTFLLDVLRLRPAGRRALSILTVVSLLGGGGLFAYPLFTDLYATEVLQEQLAEELDELDDDPAFAASYDPATLVDGDPLTRIVIDRIGLSSVVVEGTSAQALRAGAGHYPGTALPGASGNVAIAGHRTTFGQPFNRLDEVGVDDEIRLETPLGVHVYRVVGAPAEASGACPNGACWVTDPHDWGVVGPLDGPMLTLTTCHPERSARERLILRAQLVETRTV